MNARTATCVLCGVLALPCLAGDLERGMKYQERGDYPRVISAFKKASASGNAEAQRRLGFMYYHGQGVAQDDRRAVKLFEQAAMAGDIESAANLATMYEYVMGVEPDIGQAATWARRGVELGDPALQYGVSVFYYKGEGVAQERVEAAKWWTLAMGTGGGFAGRIRPGVESAEGMLTPEEIAEGRRRAAEWLKTRAATQ